MVSLQHLRWEEGCQVLVLFNALIHNCFFNPKQSGQEAELAILAALWGEFEWLGPSLSHRADEGCPQLSREFEIM
jgi:hypothetical protein